MTYTRLGRLAQVPGDRSSLVVYTCDDCKVVVHEDDQLAHEAWHEQQEGDNK